MDLVLIFITSVLVIPLVVFTDGAARTVLGLLLVLFFPGYCLMAVIFPRKTPLGVIPRLAFSVATSIVLLVIFQLVMDATTIGIQLYPALIYLVAFTAIAAAVAWWRRRPVNPDDRYSPDFRKLAAIIRFWTEKTRLDQALAGLLVIAIIGTITTIGFVVNSPTVIKSFTEFYLLDPEKKVDYYPGELAPGETGDMRACGWSVPVDKPSHPSIDLTTDAEEIRLVDINGDHLTDVVRTTGTQMQHWINLGRYVDAQGNPAVGRFGQILPDGTLSNAPITSCVLHKGTPILFSDPRVKLADVNGDGLQDIVLVDYGQFAYWPNKGWGNWGEGGDCPAGQFGANRHIEMAKCLFFFDCFRDIPDHPIQEHCHSILIKDHLSSDTTP